MNSDPLTIPQCSLVTPKTHIKLGRMQASPGQTFWVCNPAAMRPVHGCIKIARSGKNSAHAIALSFADFTANFNPVSTF